MLNTSADEVYKFNMVASACDGLSRETFQMAADPPHEIIERVDRREPIRAGTAPCCGCQRPAPALQQWQKLLVSLGLQGSERTVPRQRRPL